MPVSLGKACLTMIDFCVCACVCVFSTAEQQLLSVRLDDVGAAQLDADIRLLSSYVFVFDIVVFHCLCERCLQSLTKRSIRDAFARLSQMAMLLNLEKVDSCCFVFFFTIFLSTLFVAF